MKRFLTLILILLLTGCGQLEFYDEYTSRWNIDLPKPKNVRLGGLLDHSPKEYEDFDFIITFDEADDLDKRIDWEILNEEERYEVIEALHKKYELGPGRTIEDKKMLLGEFLNIDLDLGMAAFFKSAQTEEILLLKTKEKSEVYVLRMVKD